MGKWLNRWFWAMTLAWLVTWALGYFGAGAFQAERIEGLDPAMIPLAPTIAWVAGGVVSGLLSLVWAYSVRERTTPGESSSGPSGIGPLRRSLLFGSVALSAGGAGVAASLGARLSGWLHVEREVMAPRPPITDPNPRPQWRDAQIVSYRELGSTGFRVSDISLGTTQFMRHPDPLAFVNATLDRGINYIDTSPDYAGARVEGVIGDAISHRERDKLFIATKWCNADGHIRQGADAATYIAAVEGSLKRLRTDYVDLVHVHACDSEERLMDPGVHEAFERLRDAGKVRFMGVSTHTPNLETIAGRAIESGRFDVMMLAYHHGVWPGQVALIDAAHARGMGIVAMKTLKGGKHRGLVDFRPDADAYSQAAFKWVLSNPAVSCLVVSFWDTRHIDEYVYASGQPFAAKDLAVLTRYDELVAGTHCFAHCGVCLDSCPVNLPINDVLRYRMYFEDYGDQKGAMGLYSSLPATANAASCLGCAAPCVGACPAGVDIRTRMTGAHDLLRLT